MRCCSAVLCHFNASALPGSNQVVEAECQSDRECAKTLLCPLTLMSLSPHNAALPKPAWKPAPAAQQDV